MAVEVVVTLIVVVIVKGAVEVMVAATVSVMPKGQLVLGRLPNRKNCPTRRTSHED